MEDEGVPPNEVTYICILKACSTIGSLEIGKDIDEQVHNLGLLQKNSVLANTLLHMYSKCGALGKAQEVFVEIPSRDVVSWSALMAGYAQFGQIEVVIELIEKMRSEDILPDAVTFLVLLNACSHAGLIEEGEKLFHEMCMVYHLLPSVEHYACMIDLFGRAGNFEKVQVVASHKFTPNDLQLSLAVLGASLKWVNVNLGRWAFERSIQQDEKCSAAYICMENIYAAASMQTDHDESNDLQIDEHICQGSGGIRNVGDLFKS
jgi:pentatricopeptide repeat protein